MTMKLMIVRHEYAGNNDCSIYDVSNEYNRLM